MNWEAVGSMLLTFMVRFGTPLLAYVVLRALTVRFVSRRMMQRAPVPFAGVRDEPVPDGEVAEPREPRFLETSVAQDVGLAGEADARFTRALKSGQRTLGTIFLAALVYAAAMAVIVKPGVPATLGAQELRGALFENLVLAAIFGGLATLLLILIDRYKYLG